MGYEGRGRRGGDRGGYGERREYGGGGRGGGGYGGGGGGGYGGGGGGGYGGGGGGGGGGEFRQPPVHPGEEYDVTVTDTAAKGDGIAKIQGFIVFIPGAKPAQTCRIKIREVRSRFATADLLGAASVQESELPPEAAGKAEPDLTESEEVDEEAVGEPAGEETEE